MSLLTYTLWFSGIGRLPLASVAVLGLASPLVAATLGALLLEENLDVVQMVGFALALTAIAAGQITPSRRPPHTIASTKTTNPGGIGPAVAAAHKESIMRMADIGATGRPAPASLQKLPNEDTASPEGAWRSPQEPT